MSENVPAGLGNTNVLEMTLLKRLEETLERRTREMEQTVLARLQLAASSSSQDNSHSQLDEDLSDTSPDSRSRKRRKQSRESSSQADSIASMKQFAEEMVRKVTDVEARLDVVELRASAIEERQERLTADLDTMRREQAKLFQHSEMLNVLHQYVDRIPYTHDQVVKLTETVSEMGDYGETVKQLGGMLDQQQAVLNRMPKMIEMQDFLHKQLKKHQKMLVDLEHANKDNAQRSHTSPSLTLAQTTQQSKDLRGKSGMPADSNTIDTINNRSQADSAQSHGGTIQEMQKTVAKHQNALVQMRDYLTQHQDFIDRLCKSLGITFDGADADDTTEKLPIQFVNDLVQAQEVTREKIISLTAAIERQELNLQGTNQDVKSFEQELKSWNGNFELVRNAIVVDRQILSKVVETVGMPPLFRKKGDV